MQLGKELNVDIDDGYGLRENRKNRHYRFIKELNITIVMERVSKLRKRNDNPEYIKKKIEEIRLALNEEYTENGNTKDVVAMSQELDEYIIIEQKKSLKASEDSNKK